MPRKKKIPDPVVADEHEPTNEEILAAKDIERTQRIERGNRILSVLDTAKLIYVQMVSNGRGEAINISAIELAEGSIALAEVLEDAEEHYRKTHKDT